MNARLYKDKYWVYENGVIKDMNQKVLTQYINPLSGLRTVNLRIKGENTTRYVHKIVAQTFIDNPNNYQYVRHLNGIKNDNRSQNLEWVKTSKTKVETEKPKKIIVQEQDPTFKETSAEYKEIFDGLYRIYRDGRVYSTTHNYFAKEETGTSGNKVVWLWVNLNGEIKGKGFYIHKLLADAFIENPWNAKYVRHLDGDNGNNDLSNLEWMTKFKELKHTSKRTYHKHDLSKKIEEITPQIVEEKKMEEKEKHLEIELLPKTKKEPMYEFLNKTWTKDELIDLFLHFGTIKEVK